MKKYIYISCVMLILLVLPLISQDRAENTYDNREQASSSYTNKYPIEPAEAKTDISGYRGISIGMNMDDVLEAIKRDPLMSLSEKYFGKSGVDLANEGSDKFIAINPNKFFKSGYFLFKDDALYSIIIKYQPKQIDFLELLTALDEKYGKGAFMDPDTVAWQLGSRQLLLERPTTIKYSDMDVSENVIINYTNLFVTNTSAILEGL